VDATPEEWAQDYMRHVDGTLGRVLATYRDGGVVVEVLNEHPSVVEWAAGTFKPASPAARDEEETRRAAWRESRDRRLAEARAARKESAGENEQ
jgi:hypothetical protein